MQHHESPLMITKAMNDKKQIVGKNLKLLRDSANFKQQEIADMLEIERGAYANFESGNREMPFKLLQKVCEIYGISFSDLFDENIAHVETDLICAFRKRKLSDVDQKEVNYFKSIVRNYIKMTKIAQNEA